jgi:hypothetical protein
MNTIKITIGKTSILKNLELTTRSLLFKRNAMNVLFFVNIFRIENFFPYDF